MLWAYGRLRHAPPAKLEQQLLVPLLERGEPMALTSMSSRELAKLATAFSMMRRRDRWEVKGAGRRVAKLAHWHMRIF